MRYPCALLFVIMILDGASGLGQKTMENVPEHPAFSERINEREQMVERDIAHYPYQPVKDPGVLDAMRRVPRHVFVPEDFRDQAYQNTPLLIGYNQTISQPYMVAYMTELLDIQTEHKVLEIGTGSGYQAAILGELCDHVYSIEIVEALGLKAENLLQELGYGQIEVRIGDGYEGWPEKAPFDRIIVTCAPEDIPQPIVDQLSPGGHIVIPVGEENQTQYLVFVSKNKKGEISRKYGHPVRFVPMTGKSRK